MVRNMTGGATVALDKIDYTYPTPDSNSIFTSSLTDLPRPALGPNPHSPAARRTYLPLDITAGHSARAWARARFRARFRDGTEGHQE